MNCSDDMYHDWLAPLPLSQDNTEEDASFSSSSTLTGDAVPTPFPEAQVSSKKPAPAENPNLLLPDGSIPMEKPKRALSAYNLFFKEERERLLASRQVRASGKPRKSHGKCGFQEMASIIGSRWRSIDADYKEMLKRDAKIRMDKYKRDIKEYRRQQELIKEMQGGAAQGQQAEIEPLHVPRTDPGIAQLARQLDSESIDFIIRTLS